MFYNSFCSIKKLFYVQLLEATGGLRSAQEKLACPDTGGDGNGGKILVCFGYIETHSS